VWVVLWDATLRCVAACVGFGAVADDFRGSVKRKECACPLANASYTNLLLDAPSLARARVRERAAGVAQDETLDAPPALGSTVAADGLLQLWLLTAEQRYSAVVEAVLRSMQRLAASYPLGFGRLLCAYDLNFGPAKEIAIAGPVDAPEVAAFRQAIWSRYLPNKVVAGGEPVVPLLKGRELIHGRPAAYVCHSFACELPVTDPAALLPLLHARHDGAHLARARKHYGRVRKELDQGGFVFAGQGNDQGLLVGWVAAQVLGDLQGLAAAHGQIDDDGVGVEALGLNAGLEAAVGYFVLVILVVRQHLLEPLDEQLLGADDEDLVPSFFL